MNKEELIKLGLTDELANKVVENYGHMIPKTRLDEEIEKKKDLEKQLKDKEEELAELIKSNADNEKAKQASETEFSKYKSDTDKKIAELTAFQKNYFRTETLKNLGLEVELWDYVKGDTEEEIKKSAESLKNIISKKAETAVGGKVETKNSYTDLTAEKFGKMTYAEKAELYQNDKELYEKLSKGE